MKALVYTAPQCLEIRDVDDPVPASDTDDVLIRIDSVGICGSDMHAFLGHDERRPAPIILGHEAAGVVKGGHDDGRRVTVNPLVSCGDCGYCKHHRENLCVQRQIISMPPREGAFAQYLCMPRSNLVTVPENVGFEKASLAEPVACGWHATWLAERSLQRPLSDAKTLVIGAGPIGVGAALSSICLGVCSPVVVEFNQQRRDYLAGLGELDVRAPEDLAADDRFDLVIDCVGHAQTRAQASKVAAPGGVIVHIGLGEAEGGLDVRRMTLQDIAFVGSYTYTAAEFRDVAQALFDGRLGKLEWTESRSLEDGAAAFADIRGGRARAPKIVLKPGA